MKNLNQNRWQEIDTLFNEVLDQPTEKRESFITASCGTDTDLKQHVEKLLQIHEEAGNILGDSAGAFVVPLLPGLMDEVANTHVDRYDDPGSTVGSYQILDKIGRGGMGTVYLAEKSDAPYDKKVALKLVRKGVDSRDALQRFRRESQILALLEHPNIARLYDGGIHTDGRPYVVMEYIEGEPIDAYCDRNKFSVAKRLKLFKTVCEAVHYAHQGLVIHRDIKPANVLVTSHGEIKLVDFGIAKLLEPGSSESGAYHTQTGMKIMTPEFAAPEQIQEKTVTTASDIYGLGVLLYLLLTGRRPYRLGTASLLEMERIVCKIPPISPSEAVTGKPLPSPAGVEEEEFDSKLAAQLRGKDLESLKRELSGDLDQIILKALRKESKLRYRSVLGFAEDLDNYLKGRPVQARPATFWYRSLKLIERNRWAASAVAVAIFSLLTGLGVALWQADIARGERDIAQREAAKARAAQDYLVNLFKATDPAQTQGEKITVSEVIERGIDKLEEDLGNQPEVHAEMLKVLGQVEMALGDYNLSAELLEEALIKIKDLQGEEHINYAAVSSLLGEAIRRLGDYDRADSLIRDAIDIQTEYIQEDDEVALNMNRLASVKIFKGNYEEAEILYNQALEIRERLFGDDSKEVAENLNGVSWLYHQMGKLDEAETALRKSLMIRQKELESPHPSIATTLSNLAGVLRTKGNLRESEKYFKQALEQERTLHGDDHPRITTVLSNLSLLHLDMARYSEAANQYREVLANNRRQLGPGHLYVGLALMRLSTALIEDSKSNEAFPLLDEMFEIYRSKVGERHKYFAKGLMTKADALYYADPYQSITILQQVIDLLLEISNREQPEYAEALTRLGRAQFAVGETESAIISLRESFDIQQRTLAPSHPNKLWTMIKLGQVLIATGQLEEAESILNKTVEISDEILPSDHWHRIKANLELAACIKAKGLETEAREKIEKAMIALQGRTDFHAARLQARMRELLDNRT